MTSISISSISIGLKKSREINKKNSKEHSKVETKAISASTHHLYANKDHVAIVKEQIENRSHPAFSTNKTYWESVVQSILTRKGSSHGTKGT